MNALGFFVTALVAVNVALPSVVSPLIRAMLSGAPRLAAAVAAAGALVALNFWIERRFPALRWWARGLSALNLLALVLLGSISAVTALPFLMFLLTAG